jgi:hypothetical protein
MGQWLRSLARHALQRGCGEDQWLAEDECLPNSLIQLHCGDITLCGAATYAVGDDYIEGVYTVGGRLYQLLDGMYAKIA